MPETLGVGFIGAGPVVQSIHLPTLERLSPLFRVSAVVDVDADVAGAVASRSGARVAASVEDLLADESVDVVAVCSPAHVHAEHVLAAVGAGKRAVLCEKPLATDRAGARALAEAAGDAHVVVGAMHTVDPAWTAARSSWGDLPDRVHTVRSRIVLPHNTRYEEWSTQLLPRPAPSQHDDAATADPADPADPAVRAAVFSDAVFGLAVHDLPLVRAFLPEGSAVEVVHAQLLEPWGYLALLRAGDRTVQLTGLVTGRWEPQWTFEAVADDAELHLALPPSFVHAGSGVATLTRGRTSTVLGPFPANGYEVEWELVAAAAAGGTSAAPDRADVVADLLLAVDVAEQASALLLAEGRAA